MTTGLLINNSSGIIQIDQDYSNQIASSIISKPAALSGDWLALPSGVDMRQECPAIFVRSAGWVGNLSLTPYISGTLTPAGAIFYYSTAPVEFVFCSSLNPTRGGNMLEVYSPSGKLAYGSNQRYPRIVQMAQLNGSAVQTSVAAINDPSLWFCINPVVPGLSRPLGQGSDMSYPPYVHMCALVGGAMSFKFIENGYATNGLAENSSLSPYNGRTCRIPIAYIPA